MPYFEQTGEDTVESYLKMERQVTTVFRSWQAKWQINEITANSLECCSHYKTFNCFYQQNIIQNLVTKMYNKN